VVKTFEQVLINQMNLLQIAASKLPCDPETGEPYLKIDMYMGEKGEACGDAMGSEVLNSSRVQT
jgi:hypothetical protein